MNDFSVKLLYPPAAQFVNEDWPKSSLVRSEFVQ